MGLFALNSLAGWVIWLILVIVFVAAEIVSFNLITIWFALGSLVAMALALFGAGPLWQILAFIVVSAASVALFIYFRDKLGLTAGRIDKTNADRNIGSTGVVIQKIDNIMATGQVKVNGQIWSAKSMFGEVIEEGALVEVAEIKGVNLFVTSKKENIKEQEQE